MTFQTPSFFPVEKSFAQIHDIETLNRFPAFVASLCFTFVFQHTGMFF